MALRVAFQMDPIDRLVIRGDSTFALMLEAQRRGHELLYYTPGDLALRDRQIVAHVNPVTVADEEAAITGSATAGSRTLANAMSCICARTRHSI